MIALGMTCLGGFVGFVIMRALAKITDWKKPIAIISGILSAAVAGGVLGLLKWLNEIVPVGEKIFYYPVGLAYGAAVTSLLFVGYANITALRVAHIFAVLAATVLLFLILFVTSFRDLLPT